MNPASLASLFFNGSIRKYAVIALCVLVFVLSMPVLAVFALGGDVTTYLSQQPSAEYAEEQGFYMGPNVPGNTYVWGNCTWWAYAMRAWANDPIPTSWGNANTWDDRANRDGYLVDHTPTVGAIFQTDGGSELGHVAYVSVVNPDTGEWTISEMNAKGLNIVSTRTFAASSASAYNFIHDKIGD